jgi:hypothetical protein
MKFITVSFFVGSDQQPQLESYLNVIALRDTGNAPWLLCSMRSGTIFTFLLHLDSEIQAEPNSIGAIGLNRSEFEDLVALDIMINCHLV